MGKVDEIDRPPFLDSGALVLVLCLVHCLALVLVQGLTLRLLTQF
jgi:hypothetical protein